MDLNQITVGVTDVDAAIAFYTRLGLYRAGEARRFPPWRRKGAA